MLSVRPSVGAPAPYRTPSPTCSTSDFLSTLSMLQQDQASLEKANKEAERRLKLTKMGA